MRSIFKIMMMSSALVAGLTLNGQDASKTLLQTERMAKELDLNEKQKAALDKELKANQEERKAKMEQIRAMREEIKRDAFVERQAKEERIKNILTEEQLAKYESLKAERKSRAELNGRRGTNDKKRIGQGNSEDRKQMLQRRQKRLKEMKEKGGEENH